MAEPLYRNTGDVMFLDHWKEYRPWLVRALNQQGKLKLVFAHEVAERVGAVETSALASGLSLDAAHELGNLELKKISNSLLGPW